jgi:hypothetical protein
VNTRRVLAAAAVAGWSKGIVGAAVLPAVMEQPAGAAVTTAAPAAVVAATPACTPTPTLSGLSLVHSPGQPARVSVYAKGPSSCPGTVSILVASEQGNWGKSPVIASQHVNPGTYQPVSAQCLTGTLWYKGRFVSDDGSVSINTDSVAPTRFTC